MKVITKYKNNKDFHTTLINCVFQFKCNKEEIMAYTILSRLLLKTNRKYPEIDLFAREKLSRYIMSYNVSSQSINDVYFINFSMFLPNEGVISDYDINESINFLLDSIYDTNIYDVELFEREKRVYIEYLLDMYKNIEFIAEKNMLDLLDQDCIFNKIKYKDIENIKNLKVDDIINFYNKYIKNVKPKVFVYGNVDEVKINDIFNNYFNELDLKNYKIIKNYDSFYKDEEFIEKTDSSKYNQSIIYMVYSVKDYSNDDFYKLYLINLLLSNSSSDILFDNLRRKNNLVYSCGSSILIRNGLLIIKTSTSKNNIKLCKAVIDKVISELRSIDKYKDNIDRIIRKLEDNLIREKDNFFVEPSNIINNYFESDKSIDEVLNILKNIDINSLEEFIMRLSIKCVYTMEGI